MQDRQLFKEYKLKNGITVYSHAMDMPFFSLQVLLPVGSNHSHEGNAAYGGVGGVAHFLEHLIFSRSKKYPKKHQFEDIIFMSGGHWNAWTGPFSTNIYIEAPVSHQQEMVEGLLSHIYEPIFDAKDIEIERGIISNEREQRKYFPSGTELGKYIYTKWAFDQFSPKTQVFGSDADLACITPESLALFHASYFSKKAAVFVAGGHDIDAICEAFSKIETNDVALEDKHAPIGWAKKEYHEAYFKDIDKPVYFIGGLMGGSDLLEERKLNFLHEFLINHGNGALHTWIRKEKGWSYGLGGGVEVDIDRTAWMIRFPLNDIKNVEELRRDLRTKIEQAIKNETLIKKEKERRLAGRLFLYQTMSDRIDTAVEQYEAFGRIPLESEYRELLERVADPKVLAETYEKYFAAGFIGEFLALPFEPK